MLARRKVRKVGRARDIPFAGLNPREAQERLEALFRRRRFPWQLQAIAFIWAIAVAYYLLMPASYVSKWTLILPVSNGGSSVSLDTIGQMSTVQSQTFGSGTLTPKVIYREIADSEQVRAAAAKSMGLMTSDFGRARVRLIDETSLMMFQMTGRTAEDAQRRAQSHFAAFEAQLDVLRRDEVERRGQTVRESLKSYQVSLDQARERILEFQRATGMLSVAQFNEAVSSAELMRRKLSDARADLQKLASQQALMIDRVGIGPLEAAAGLKLASNPAFAKLAASFADSNSTAHEQDRVFGPNHPARTTTQLKLEGAMAEVKAIARRVGVDASVDLRRLVLFVNSSHQADLLHLIVTNESALEGRRKEVASLEAEMIRLERDVGRMSQHAARLEYLKKDHLVAEAVFTSAAARLDINRSDIYSSYPLVQTLGAPDLPTDRSQPQLILALAGGLAGTFLVVIAWGVAWVRRTMGQRSNRARSKSA